MNKQKIYYFAYSNLDTASVRYRGVNLLEKIKQKLDVNYIIITPERKKLVFLLPILIFEVFILNPIKNIKSVFICQKISKKNYYYDMLYFFFFFLKKEYYYDIDDAMYVNRDKNVVNKFIINAKKVFVSSTELKNYCVRFNKETHLLTTPVPISKNKKEHRNNIFNIGWIGYFSHYKNDLYTMLFPSIKKIQFPTIFSILGISTEGDLNEVNDYFSENINIKIYAPLDINWQNEDYISKEISKFDVGVAPSSNTEINRAKSAFKIKQYLSCGVPAIASDVGDNRLFIKNDVNGFLCKHKSDFANYINIFCKMNKDKFDEFIKNCNVSEQEYSIDKFYNDFISLIK